jgi:hypothetical protein
VIGLGSASFARVRELVDRFPAIPAPNWLPSSSEASGRRSSVRLERKTRSSRRRVGRRRLPKINVATRRDPGQHRLDFDVQPDPDGSQIRQTTTIDSTGWRGVATWFVLYPLHNRILTAM